MKEVVIQNSRFLASVTPITEFPQECGEVSSLVRPSYVVVDVITGVLSQEEKDCSFFIYGTSALPFVRHDMAYSKERYQKAPIDLVKSLNFTTVAIATVVGFHTSGRFRTAVHSRVRTAFDASIASMLDLHEKLQFRFDDSVGKKKAETETARLIRNHGGLLLPGLEELAESFEAAAAQAASIAATKPLTQELLSGLV